jgi:hypothetical protein
MMQAVEKTSERSTGEIIDLQCYMNNQKDNILQELLKTVPEEFRSDYAENPYLRLLLKYEGMSDLNKDRTFSFVEKIMEDKRRRRISKKDIFADMLAFGNKEIWRIIEEFEDKQLMCHKGPREKEEEK